MSSKSLRSRSRELRGGRLMANCNCTRRDGLQYDCKRTECQGSAVCLTKLHPKCCPALFGNRFENVSMGKRTNPSGARRIKVLNNGSKYFHRLPIRAVAHFSILFFFAGCVVQYDPAVGVPENSQNPCGPKNPICDRHWKTKTTQTN